MLLQTNNSNFQIIQLLMTFTPKLDSTHRKMHNNLEQVEFRVKVDNSKHNCSKN